MVMSLKVFIFCVAACCLYGAVAARTLDQARAAPGGEGEKNQYKLPLFGGRCEVGIVGVDVSTRTSTKAFNCLRRNGKEFAIVRAFRSNGITDVNAPSTIASAWAGGFSRVDIYIFPCFNCGNPSSQVTRTENSRYRMIWIDVEQQAYWSNDKAANRRFFTEMLQTAQRYKPTGVYTSMYYWPEIMGYDFTGAAHVPLWYPRFDTDPSFSDFTSFGGWARPNIKQFDADKEMCGAVVDLNWQPGNNVQSERSVVH
ncbi:probable GH family 25 lysozyme 2 isoform X2 [Corticium candelabrum]|uniref:probable GH family 25 lysozyme 2 isoform X2 n=1 Tax=Corticium candelabrum TaxID=121492 RepID=UPI002E2602A7|nr:probable GH family 25 lysozyme 2 isoform X2 [Corticium candelabrum]